MDLFYENLYSVNPTVRTIETSARTGLGIDEWCSWLTTPRKAARRSQGTRRTAPVCALVARAA
jgi:hydrogenase nickel incorporation protein HypB